MGANNPDVTAETKGGNAQQAKDAVTEIEKIGQDKSGQEFLSEVTKIMESRGLTGDDATSHMVLQELERRGQLPRVLVAGLANESARDTIGNGGDYTRERLQDVADGKGSSYGTQPSEGSRLLANALLQRFDAIEDIDKVFHARTPNYDQHSGKVNISDIQVYAGVKDHRGDAEKLDQRKAELRPQVNEMLQNWNQIRGMNVDGLPQDHIFRKIQSGQKVTKADIESALQIDRNLADRAGDLNDAEKAKLGLMTEEQRRSLNFLVADGRYDKVMALYDKNPGGIDDGVIDRYARAMGTTRDNAQRIYAGFDAIDNAAPEVQRAADHNDPKVANPEIASNVASRIGQIDTTKVHGQELLNQVDAIMQERGLNGNDATSRAVIAQLERDGKLPALMAAGFGNQNALRALGGYSAGGYHQGQLQEIAENGRPFKDAYNPREHSADASPATRLIARAMLDRFNAMEGLRTIQSSDKREDRNLGSITLDDINAYRDVKPEDRATADNLLSVANAGVKETDPAFVQALNKGEPLTQAQLQEARNAHDAAQRWLSLDRNQNATVEQKRQQGLLTEQELKALDTMIGNYDTIVKTQQDGHGVTKDGITRFAQGFGTTPELAQARAAEIVAPPEVTDGSPGGDGLTPRQRAANDIVSAVRMLPPDQMAQLQESRGVLSRDQLRQWIQRDEETHNLTVAQRNAFNDLEQNWDSIAGGEQQLNVAQILSTPEELQGISEKQNRADADAQLALKSIGGQDLSAVADEDGNLSKQKIDDFLKQHAPTADVADAAKDPQIAALEYLSANFDQISHDGQVVTQEQLAHYAKVHEAADYQPYLAKASEEEPQGPPAPESDKYTDMAEEAFDKLAQMEKMRSGEFPYDMAKRILADRSKLTGEPTSHDAIMKEVARICIVNEIGPGQVLENLQKKIADPNYKITMKDLPRDLNYVRRGEELRLYDDKDAFIKAIADRMREKDKAAAPAPEGDNYSANGAPRSVTPGEPGDDNYSANGAPRTETDAGDDDDYADNGAPRTVTNGEDEVTDDDDYTEDGRPLPGGQAGNDTVPDPTRAAQPAPSDVAPRDVNGDGVVDRDVNQDGVIDEQDLPDMSRVRR